MRTKAAAASASDPCIYCGSTVPRTKREHVMSQALGTYEQNWVLDCVCDECNGYFSKYLELALARDSYEGMLRIDLGIRPPEAAEKLLHRRMTATLQDPGPFDGMRVGFEANHDGTKMVPAPAPQVCFRRPGEPWQCLFEWQLTPERVWQTALGSNERVEIRVVALTGQGASLRQKLADLGVYFEQTYAEIDQPLTEQRSITVAYDFQVDEVLIRSAAKIAFNYAAKVLGADAVRRTEFDAARRFVRYGEVPDVGKIATARHGSLLVGTAAAGSRTHACAVGWVPEQRQLIAIVTLFNEMTYVLRLCDHAADEFAGVSFQHAFDPISRQILPLPVAA